MSSQVEVRRSDPDAISLHGAGAINLLSQRWKG